MSETGKLKERMATPDWDVWLSLASSMLGRLADAKDARREKARTTPAQPGARGAQTGWLRSLLPELGAGVARDPAPAIRRRKRGFVASVVRTVRWTLWGVALGGAGAAGFGLRGAGQPGWSWRRDGLGGPAAAGLAALGLALAGLAGLERAGLERARGDGR